MKSFIVLSIVSLITYITSEKCTVPWAEANPAFIYPKQCLNATNLEQKEGEKYLMRVEVAPCKDKGYNCPIPDTVEADKPAFCENFSIQKELLAGDSCLHDLECYSQECISGKCYGRSYNETCDNHKECDVGLACRVKDYPKDGEHKPITVCVPQISNNHTFCTEDEHCINSMGCNNYENNVGVCVTYFSLSNFEKSSSADLCSSGYVHSDGRCIDTLFIAQEGKTSASFECIGENNNCIYQIDGKPTNKELTLNTFSKPCECSKSAEPKSYCSILDTLSAKGKAKLAEAKKRIVTGVHTTRRHSDSQLTKDFYFPKYEGATDNIYKAHQSIDASSYSSFIKISLIGLFLIFAL